MKKILLIGGTPFHRGMLKASLEEEGFHVSAAITERYTNRWLSRRLKPFDLIIYDTEQAERDPDFWKELREAAGSTPILVLTSVFDQIDYPSLGMNRVMRRPYAIGDVIKAARELLHETDFEAR